MFGDKYIMRPYILFILSYRVEIANLGNIDVSTDVDTQNQIGTRPIGINEIESSINNFPNILPQGTTSARPIGPELPQQSPIVDRIPSISNLPTTTPPSSAFLDSLPGFVPGTNTGNSGEIKTKWAAGGIMLYFLFEFNQYFYEMSRMRRR